MNVGHQRKLLISVKAIITAKEKGDRAQLIPG